MFDKIFGNKTVKNILFVKYVVVFIFLEINLI